MIIVKTIVFFELTLFLTLWIGVATGLSDSIPEIPYAGEIAGFLILLSLAGATIARFKDDSSTISAVSAFGLATIGFTIHHIFPNLSSYPLPPLYFLIVFATGVLSKPYVWILPFLTLITGEVFRYVGRNPPHEISVITGNIFQYLSDASVPLVCLLAGGCIPSCVRNRHSTSSVELKKFHSLPEPIIQPDSPSAPAAPAKTQFFTTDYINGLKQNGTGEVQDLLASVVYFMSRNFKTYSALGFIYVPENHTFVLNSYQSKSLSIAKGVEIPLGKGLIGKIGTDKRSFMSGNISNYNSELLYYTGYEEINSILAVPIISDQKELLGTLVLDSPDKHAFKDQDHDILRRFSSLAAALITNARIRMIQEQAAHTFQIFYQASHQFTTALNFKDVFEVLYHMVPLAVSCTRQIALIYDEKNRVIRISRIIGESPELVEGAEFEVNAGLYSFVLQKRKLLNIADYQHYTNKYYRFSPDEQQNMALRSLIIFPITDDERRSRGLFSIESSEPNQFIGDIEQTLATLVENASVAFTRALLYQKMEKLATTDGLTGLFNHRHFQEVLARELERARRYKHTLSLLLMDIDHFKSFNDTYGHPVGDLVLKEIAACIHTSIRVNDIPARYGGEEFTVIIPETDQQGALVIAERIRTTIQNHCINSLNRELRVTVSIGFASFPATASSQPELIDRADKALYYSKEHGRNRATLWQPQMG